MDRGWDAGQLGLAKPFRSGEASGQGPGRLKKKEVGNLQWANFNICQ